MKTLLSKLCATALTASFVAASAVPLSAAPMMAPRPAVAIADHVAAPNVVQVQYNDRERWIRRQMRREARHAARNDWELDRRSYRRGYRDGVAYHNGYRGYRYYRPGYRRSGDFWFPAAAFVAGALVGNAIATPAPRVVVPRGMSSAHVEWCYNRYRSYRASDNTFQPYNGPRQPCYSPYS